jgi:hypothetical protein
MGCLIEEKLMEIGKQFYMNDCRVKLIIKHYNLWGGVVETVIPLDSELFGTELLSPRELERNRIVMDGYARVLDGYDDECFEKFLDEVKRYGYGFSYKTVESVAWGFLGFKIHTYDVSVKVKRILSMELVIDVERSRPLRNKSFEELQKIVTPELIKKHEQAGILENYFSPRQMLERYNNL